MAGVPKPVPVAPEIAPGVASPAGHAAPKDATLQPTVGWAETRRLVRLDLEGYERWLPDPPVGRSRWRRLATALGTTQGFAANVLYRLQVYLDGAGWRRLGIVLQRLSFTLFSVTIGRNVRVGGGLHLPHGNVVLDGVTTLGRNVTVSPFVVVGLSNGSRTELDFRGPVIGDDVYIGAGARILGPVRVGDRVKVGASAVVVHDVPADHTAVGIPAGAYPSKR